MNKEAKAEVLNIEVEILFFQQKIETDSPPRAGAAPRPKFNKTATA